MAIPRISHRPTIVIGSQLHVETNTRNSGATEGSGLSATESIATLKPEPVGPNWLRRLWDRLSLALIYWDMLCSIPFDLYLEAFFTESAPDIQESPTINRILDPADDATLGPLALHPTLPLLAVSTSDRSDILLYSTETAKSLHQIPVELRKTDDAPVNSKITCLKFSTGNKLAAGLDHGIVHIIEQDLSALLRLHSGQRREHTAKLQVIELLPFPSSKYEGRVTNLAFSPTGDILSNKEDCLAIATEKSGVWICNQNTKEVIRVINTGGINDGCMHWISLSERPKKLEEPQTPIQTPAVEKQPIDDSAMQRFASIFGGAENLSKLDEYFAPTTQIFQSHVQSSQHLFDGASSATDSVGGLSHTSSTNSHGGQSLLIFGSKKGRIRVQKLWHSRSMMRLETFIEFSPSDFAQSPGKFKSMSGPASGQITHLAILPHTLTSSQVSVPILVAFSGDNSSILHQFSVSVPLTPPTQTWLSQTMQTAIPILKSLVNLFLLGTNYRIISLQTSGSQPGSPSPIIHHVAHTIRPNLSRKTVFPQFPSSLTSTSVLPLTSTILATVRRGTPWGHFSTPKPDSCVLLHPDRYDDPSSSAASTLLPPDDPAYHPSFPTTLTTTAIITPPEPLPLALTTRPSPPPPPPMPKGYYWQKTHQAGVLSTPPPAAAVVAERKKHGAPPERAEVDGFCRHAYECGRVAWGGAGVGAFLYQPATPLEKGAGVCVFEVLEGEGGEK